MKKLISSVRKFISDESGATAIEYGLIASVVGLVMAVGAGQLGTNLSTLFGNIATQLLA